MDSTTGNVNFFRSIEGFAEALPQSVYQLSIMMRTEWTLISKFKIFDMNYSSYDRIKYFDSLIN